MGGVGVRGAPSRRAVLALPAAGVAAAGLVTAAGCSESRPAGTPAPPPVDLAAAQAAARAERDLLVDYDAAIARHPALAALLGGLRAHHAQHLAALATQVPALATATPDGTVTSGGSPSASAPATPSGAATAPAAGTSLPGSAGPQPGADDSPAARASALAELATSERAAADEHRAGCLAATGGLAPLLASLRAAESCHADLLSLAGSAG